MSFRNGDKSRENRLRKARQKMRLKTRGLQTKDEAKGQPAASRPRKSNDKLAFRLRPCDGDIVARLCGLLVTMQQRHDCLVETSPNLVAIMRMYYVTHHQIDAQIRGAHVDRRRCRKRLGY